LLAKKDEETKALLEQYNMLFTQKLVRAKNSIAQEFAKKFAKKTDGLQKELLVVKNNIEHQVATTLQALSAQLKQMGERTDKIQNAHKKELSLSQEVLLSKNLAVAKKIIAQGCKTMFVVHLFSLQTSLQILAQSNFLRAQVFE